MAGERDGGYGIPWWTADSGGGQSSGGSYSLRGTVGQPDAAVVTAGGGGYTLHGGFWRTLRLQPLTVQPLAVQPLTVQPLTDQTAQVGGSISLQVQVSNPLGGALLFSANGLPPGLQIDPATGLICGQLADGSVGVYTLTVTVTNSGGASAQTSFTFTVTAPTALDEQPEPDMLPRLYLPLTAR